MNNNNKKMRYVGAPCGSGKTFAVCKLIGEAAKSGSLVNTLMISPSKDLIRQTKEQLMKFGVVPEVITGDTTTNVAAYAVELFKNRELEGQVVLMTHAGFQRTPVFLYKEEWQLYVDEIPSVDKFHDPIIPYNHKLLTDYLDILPLTGKVNEVIIKPGLELAVKKFLAQSSDDIHNVVKPVLRDLIEGRKMYADTKAYGKIVEQLDVSKDTPEDAVYGNSRNKLYFLSMLTPSSFEGWGEITILGANFETSMLAKYWNEYHQVVFEPAEEIYANLRYEQHDIGQRLSIRYFQEDTWSKYQRDLEPHQECNFKTYGHAMDDYAENNLFKDAPYVYVANTDYNNAGLKNAERMPVISHGLNHYQNHTNVYYSPAINRQPKHMQMLEAIGFDNVYVQRATSHEIVYQAIMRCALRNPDDNRKVNVVVPDKASCHSLVRLFPGCSVGGIGSDKLKRTKVPAKSVGERKRRSKFNKLLDDMKLIKRVRFSLIDEDCTDYINLDITPDDMANEGAVLISFFSDIHAKQGITENITDLVETRRNLKSIFTANVYGDGSNIPTATGKKDNYLCSPAVFNPNKSDDTDRGLDNVEYTSFLALDFDDGDLTPDDFIKIFWAEALRGEKLAFDIMNSAGHAPANNVNKFRVFIYYTTSASIEEHYAIFDTIKSRLAANGYLSFRNDKDRRTWLSERGLKHIKESGLDLSKRPPNSLFYLPGKLKGREDVAFFKSFGNDANRLKGLLIDPATYYQHQSQKTELVPIEYEPHELAKPIADIVHAMNDGNEEVSRQGKVDGFMQQYRSIPVGGGQRNYGLFVLAWQLRKMGLDISEVERHLRDVACGEKKILGRIPGVLKSIQKQKYVCH